MQNSFGVVRMGFDIGSRFFFAFPRSASGLKLGSSQPSQMHLSFSLQYPDQRILEVNPLGFDWLMVANQGLIFSSPRCVENGFHPGTSESGGS